jgi:hypothetical protein
VQPGHAEARHHVRVRWHGDVIREARKLRCHEKIFATLSSKKSA